jgi:hypothetical protein
MIGSPKRFALALLACATAMALASGVHADFAEFEDNPFQDPNDLEVDPLSAAAPVPWNGVPFASAFPDGVKLIRGSLDAGDVDAYAFSLEAGQLVLGALFEDAAGERNDTELGLFGGGVVPPLASDDDGGSGFLSRFAFGVTSSATFQVGVTGFGDALWNGDHQEAGSGLVPYRLVVAATSDPPSRVELEPNDSVGTATMLPIGGAVVGASLASGDVDFFSIELEAGDRLAISVFDLETGHFESAAGERNDTLLTLLDPWGAAASAGPNDDGGAGFASNALYTADAGGLWTVAVSGFGDDAFVGDHQEAAFDYLLVVARERACPSVVPLISNIAVSTANPYSVAALKEGDHYYTDRNDAGRHVLVDIPPAYACSQWIKTANNDKNVSDPGHLGFVLLADASVFVGYDSRATGEPSWLATGFTPTNETLDVADPSPNQEFDLLRRDFAAGSVVLGGNAAPGAGSNYVVFARPLPTDDPEQSFTVPDDASMLSITISGVVIEVSRPAGQTSADFAEVLAQAVNTHPTLAAARIYGLASGATFVTTGQIEDAAVLNPVPLSPVVNLVGLILLMSGFAYRIVR